MNNGKKSGYLVLGYACNQRCRGCPLVHKDKRQTFIGTEALFREIDGMYSFGVTDITLSGGEPTLHPSFFDVIQHCFNKGMAVHILSNGESFCREDFSEKLITLSKQGELSVTTTFHSVIPEEHEYQNGSVGSFTRSMEGLIKLDANEVNVSVKHCITAYNYQQLPSFIEYVLVKYSSNAEIQLWGIDLCGIDEENARKMFVSFSEIGKYLMKAIDLFEKDKSFGQRVLTVNNLPLCMCDCYYWRYFSSLADDTYINHKEGGKKMEPETGPISENCVACGFSRICMGAYYSNFSIMGDDIVGPPEMESPLSRVCSGYHIYCADDLNKTYFTPYVTGSLILRGLELTNNLSGESVIIRAHTQQLLALLGMLREGVQMDILQAWLQREGIDDGTLLMNMQKKGIIE